MCTVVALEKFKIRVCQGVSGGTKTLFWAFFACFLRFFVFFFSFLYWNQFIFGLQLVYSILVHICTVVALEKFKIMVCQGVSVGTKTPFWAFFACFLRFFVFSFSFLHLNHVIFGLQLVQSIFLHMCTVVALGKFKTRVCQGVQKHHFEPFLPIFWDFLSFSSVFHIGIMLYLVYN